MAGTEGDNTVHLETLTYGWDGLVARVLEVADRYMVGRLNSCVSRRTEPWVQVVSVRGESSFPCLEVCLATGHLSWHKEASLGARCPEGSSLNILPEAVGPDSCQPPVWPGCSNWT